MNRTQSDPLLIKINDKWVNLDVWKKMHPGGDAALERFRGQDATDAFFSLHSKEAVQKFERMTPVTVSRQIEEKCAKPSPVSLSFRKFRKQLSEEGWFERNWLWDSAYILLAALLCGFGTYISYSHPIIASILIGLGMQQAGWIGHDYVHGRGTISFWLGRIIGGLFNGFSSEWWSAKHNKHHVHTNQLGVDDDIQNDPILHLWIPSPDKEFFLRPYQHLYYHLVYAFLYVSWRIQSLQTMYERKEKVEMLFAAINYSWLLFVLPIEVSLLSVLIGGWFVAEVVTATHQSEEILEGYSYNFAEDQFRTTRDVQIESKFFNWFWGGMQYQLEHHLFPTMPKYRYAAVRPLVKKWAKENGIEYRISGPLEIVAMNYETMKKYSAHTMTTLQSLLQTPVQSIFPKGQKLITIDAKDSLQHALQTLISNNIYSAPLFDSEAKKFVGFVDLVDVVTFIIEIAEKTSGIEQGHDKLLRGDKLEFISQTSTKNLKDLAEKNPLVSVDKGALLVDALKVFVDTNARRVAIFENGEMYNILTQSAIISWLSSNIKHIPFAKKTVSELKLGFKKVISIPASSKAVEAFKMMAEKRITAVAVVDENNALFTALSAKDIKLLDLNSPFKKLFQELRKFVADVRQLEIKESIPIIWCYPTNTFQEVIQRLSILRIHRIFVVDGNKSPVGIISLGDVLKLVLSLKDTKESSSEEEESEDE